jgi:hypothetical protein
MTNSFQETGTAMLFDIVNEEFCLYKPHPERLLKTLKTKKAQVLHLRAGVRRRKLEAVQAKRSTTKYMQMYFDKFFRAADRAFLSRKCATKKAALCSMPILSQYIGLAVNSNNENDQAT